VPNIPRACTLSPWGLTKFQVNANGIFTLY